MSDSWIASPLPKLLKFMKSGGTPDTSRSDFYGGEIPFVTIDDMTRCSRYLEKTSKTLTSEGLSNSNAWLVPAGALLYSIYATLGVPRINEIPVATNQAILALLNDPEAINSDYLYYWLSFIRDSVTNLSSQTTQSNLSASVVKTFIVSHPESLLKQNKIAEILSTVDQAIDQTEALIAKQRRIKTGLMQDLLMRGIDENGNLRSEETHEFKDSPLGRIPVEWDVKEIQELLAGVKPSMRSGPFGSALLKEELLESGIPFLGIDNVLPEEFVPLFKRFVAPKKARQLKKFRVRPRDIMITVMGTVGRCCMVPDNIGEALSSKHVWTLSFDEKAYSPYLACLQINHAPWVLNHFAKDMQGGIMEAIRSETLRSTPLPVPPLDEMREIESQLRVMSTGLGTNHEVLRKLSRLKTALMQDLLTGKVSVAPLLTGLT